PPRIGDAVELGGLVRGVGIRILQVGGGRPGPAGGGVGEHEASVGHRGVAVGPGPAELGQAQQVPVVVVVEVQDVAGMVGDVLDPAPDVGRDGLRGEGARLVVVVGDREVTSGCVGDLGDLL